MSKLGAYTRFARPFTWIAPAVGVTAAAVTGLAATPPPAPLAALPLLAVLVLGMTSAVALAVAANGLNQIYDLEIDRVNKPARPLPAGRITRREAWAITLGAYAAALGLAYLLRREFFWIVAAGAALTLAYSVPPVRTKRHWLAANATIAAARGLLMFVAGWALFADLGTAEPWWLGSVFAAFLFGAATTKDYADMAGDRAHGCLTLPIRLGVRRSVYVIAPFFVLPFLLLPWGVQTAVLSGNVALLQGLGVFLALWGGVVVRKIWKDPEALARAGGNHPSWRHMYLMMLAAQTGLALAYVL